MRSRVQGLWRWVVVAVAAAPGLCLGADPGGSVSPGPMQGVRMQVIQYAADPPGAQRQAPGGGRVLAPAVLFTPAGGAHAQAPAVVMLDQGPGAHPLEATQASRFAAERLAARGYTVLSLYAGQERGFARVPFADTAHAVRGALDWLEVAGHERFVLIGQGYGAIVAAHYLATERDTLLDHGGEKRVKAVVLLDPLTELRHYPRADLLQRYEERVAQAQASVAAGRGGIPSLDPGRNVGAAYDPWLMAGPFIAPAQNWLDLWGPAAAERNQRVLRQLAVPTLALVHRDDPSTSAASLQAFSVKLYPGASSQGQEDLITEDIAQFLAAQSLTVPPRVHTRVLDVATRGGRLLQGVAYLPEGMDATQPVLVLVGGRTADTIQSSTHWMGLRLAAQGVGVFAPGLRVSGVAGFQTSTHAEAAEDIGHWIDRIAGLGHRRIVLGGHSNGGVWISNYLSLTQDPRVVGMVYFAPTRDTVSFAQAEEGEQYARHLQIARDAVERGDGLRVPIGLLSAQAWLDNNGPDSRGMHTVRVQEFDRPGLAIAGQRDPLMTPAFLEQFRRAYRGSLTLLTYPDGSHGLRENKHRLGEDVAVWLRGLPR